MIVLRDIHQCCARGFCGNRTIFWCPSLSSRDPSFPVSWTGFHETVYSGHLCHTLVVVDLQTQILLDTPTTLRGGVNECGALFTKTSLLHKTP
jgi:hypothetical protein